MKILFIDDDIERLSSHIQYLQDEGIETITVSNIHDALDLIDKQGEQLSAIVLDMIMPYGEGAFGIDETEVGHRTGIPLIKEIRKRLPQVPLVMCTVVHDPVAKKQATELGVKAYITKPVLPSDLLKSLEKVIR